MSLGNIDKRARPDGEKLLRAPGRGPKLEHCQGLFAQSLKEEAQWPLEANLAAAHSYGTDAQAAMDAAPEVAEILGAETGVSAQLSAFESLAKAYQCPAKS